MALGSGATLMTLVFLFGFSLKAIWRSTVPLLLSDDDLNMLESVSVKTVFRNERELINTVRLSNGLMIN